MKDAEQPFQVEISSPATKYRIEPVFDKIKTLEGTHAGLPYGGSSGRWGEQYDTPIGADITYYSRYEGTETFYRLNIDFPLDTIKDYMERAYSRKDDLKGQTQEYKRLGRGFESGGGKAYDSFSTCFLALPPKGWWWYG